MPNYGDPKYWENRYKNSKDTFDWLEDYYSLKSIISELVPEENKKNSLILNLGCGNSLLCEEMFDDGYKNIINIDISETVINYMQNRNKEKRKKLKFFVMDCRNLISIKNNSIDLAIDKSTIDALLCGENSFLNVAQMLKEVQRVLKIGGYYLMISYGCPENRIYHIQRKFLGFDIKIFKIAKKDNNVDISSYDMNNKNNNNNNKDNNKNNNNNNNKNNDNKDNKNNNNDNNNEYNNNNNIENLDTPHYVYICRKNSNADFLSNKYYKEVLKELENHYNFEKDITGAFSNKEKLQELINLIVNKENEKKKIENGSENNSEIEISETIKNNNNNNSEYSYSYKYNNKSKNNNKNKNENSSENNNNNKKNSYEEKKIIKEKNKK